MISPIKMFTAGETTCTALLKINDANDKISGNVFYFYNFLVVSFGHILMEQKPALLQ